MGEGKANVRHKMRSYKVNKQLNSDADKEMKRHGGGGRAAQLVGKCADKIHIVHFHLPDRSFKKLEASFCVFTFLDSCRSKIDGRCDELKAP